MTAESGDADQAVESIPFPELAEAILENRAAGQAKFDRWLADGAEQPGSGQGPGTRAGTSAAAGPVLPEALPTERVLQLIDGYLTGHDGVRAEATGDAGPGPAGGELEFRIGPGKVLHLREALKIVLVDGLGLFFAFTTTSGLVALLYAWFFLSGADIVRRFMKCFEKISDPDERAVFEALFALQNQRAAQQPGTEPDDDSPRMRRRISVSDDAIGAYLGGRIAGPDLRSLLRGMAARDIVTERDGLWSISFW
jgi:hypothetical protein